MASDIVFDSKDSFEFTASFTGIIGQPNGIIFGGNPAVVPALFPITITEQVIII